jgi:hypothetical protein
MIILSVGMPRAGSGWYYNLTNDLMLANGAQDARRIRNRYHLNRILTEVNCNIGALTPHRLIAVMAPSMMGNTFVIKAHSGPTRLALFLIRSGFIRPTHIYRDPRDAMLSAMENGQRSIEKGRSNAFTALATFDSALKFMESYVHITETWLQTEQVLQVKYEDMLQNYDQEADRLVNFLQFGSKNAETSQVIEKYRPENASTDKKGLHYSHGRIGRFRKKLNPEQQEILSNVLGPSLTRMNYEI